MDTKNELHNRARELRADTEALKARTTDKAELLRIGYFLAALELADRMGQDLVNEINVSLVRGPEQPH